MTWLRLMEDRSRTLHTWLDRYPALTFAPAALLIAAATLSMAAAKPLWHDEIYTVLLSRLGAPELWAATGSGVDLSPPLNTLLTHWVVGAAGPGPVQFRLPALAGFWLAVTLAFVFVRRRSNAVVGLAAALLTCFTAGYRYSYEARGYGLMMGLAALSLVAWSEAAAGRRRRLHLPLLALALASGCWNQYYGLMAAVPLVAGELARTARDRRVDVPVWVALAASLVALVPLLPLMRAAAAQAPTFWRKAAVADVLPTYAFLFNSWFDAPLVWGGLAALTLTALARAAAHAPLASRPADGPEVVALAASLAVPAIQIAAALMTTGAFVPRYALVAVPGGCMALALVVFHLTLRSGLAQLAFTATLAVTFAATHPLQVSFPNPARQRPALMQLLAEGRPVAVTGGLMYLQIWYYAPPLMREHLYYVADPEAAVARTGSDTIDRGLLGLARVFGVGAVPPETFLEAHSEFRVYGAGSGWLLGWLEERKMSLEQVGVELGAPILVARVGR